MIIDTHCHLDLYPNPNLLIKELEDQEIITIGMTNLPSHFHLGFRHTRSLKRCRLSLGMHPLLAIKHNSEFPLFFKYLRLTSYIGEIGLDFSREGILTKELQIISFEKILKAISGEKKILSLHSRNAEKEVFEMLQKYKIEKAIFHWYTGDLDLIDRITEAGYYFSINTAMIKSKRGKTIINRIPKELILTETDGPFIIHNNRPVKPFDIRSVISFLNGQPNFELMEEQIYSNFRKLLKGVS